MRVLCLNPNRTAFVTETVAAELRHYLGDTGEVVQATGDFGADVIKTELDHAVAQHAAVDLAARHAASVDGILLAVSYDTALDALRSSLRIPVVGMTEAAIIAARLFGRRLGYISIGAASTPLYRMALQRYDIDRDRAAWEVIEAPAAYAPGNTSGLDSRLLDAVAQMQTDGIDVVVLLGAVLAGTARRLQDRAALHLVDGGGAGAMLIQSAIKLNHAQPEQRPAGGTMTGVSDALSALAAGRRPPPETA